MIPHYVFSVLCLIWATSEIWLGRHKRSNDQTRTRDHGSLRLLLITVYGCIALAVWLSYVRLAPYSPTLREPLFWIGCWLMAAGMALRWWSIRVLAQFFTVDVAIRADHVLIRHGPYRRLRHPSYTGALMIFYGFALALGDLCSLVIIIVPATVAFLWRIHIEERVLAEAFPQQYLAYTRETHRLIPFVW